MSFLPTIQDFWIRRRKKFLDQEKRIPLKRKERINVLTGDDDSLCVLLTLFDQVCVSNFSASSQQVLCLVSLLLTEY